MKSIEKALERYDASIHPVCVNRNQYLSRIKRLEKSGKLNEASVEDAMYLEVEQYKQKYALRKTYLAGDKVSLNERYEELLLTTESAVNYPIFRKRCKLLVKKGKYSEKNIRLAFVTPPEHWKAIIGTGRATEFMYQGDLYPEHNGETFPSVAQFLSLIGRSGDKKLIWDRIQRGMSLDASLSIPKYPPRSGTGFIYCYTCQHCGMQYVGQTKITVEERDIQHQNCSQTDVFHTHMREVGRSNFSVKTLEENVPHDKLSDREKFWIRKLNTRIPNGLNTLLGGQEGSLYGTPCSVEEGDFVSKAEAGRVIAKQKNISPWVVEDRIRKGLPIPDQHRTHSKHPDAGSNLYRRWLSLNNSIDAGRREGEVSKSWRDYDNFKNDVMPDYTPEVEIDKDKQLIRLDKSKPWGGDNFKWASAQERVAQTHGEPIVVNGIPYNSKQSVARAYGMPPSTLRYLLSKGMTIEEAVEKWLKK